MKTTLKESIPETTAGLEIFVQECDREIKWFSKIKEMAARKLKEREEEADRVKRKAMGLKEESCSI